MRLAGWHDFLQFPDILLQTLHRKPVPLLHQLRHDDDNLLPGRCNVEIINGLQFLFRKRLHVHFIEIPPDGIPADMPFQEGHQLRTFFCS